MILSYKLNDERIQKKLFKYKRYSLKSCKKNIKYKFLVLTVHGLSMKLYWEWRELTEGTPPYFNPISKFRKSSPTTMERGGWRTNTKSGLNDLKKIIIKKKTVWRIHSLNEKETNYSTQLSQLKWYQKRRCWEKLFHLISLLPLRKQLISTVTPLRLWLDRVISLNSAWNLLASKLLSFKVKTFDMVKRFNEPVPTSSN